MIGQAIWSEFFANKDWPTAAAVAVVLICLLVTPIVVFQRQTMRGQIIRGQSLPSLEHD
jgi:putrescine transport system permease protein